MMSDSEDGQQNSEQPLSANPPPSGYNQLPPGYFTTSCVRCNAVQNIPLFGSAFYACWQCKALNYPAQRQKPAVKTTASKRDKRLLVILAAAAVLVVSVGGYFVGKSETENNKMIAESHSEDPKLQAFYLRLVKDGFGTMRRGDAMKWAKEACNNTDGLMGIWGEKDKTGEAYGPLDNQTFRLAAMSYCRS